MKISASVHTFATAHKTLNMRDMKNHSMCFYQAKFNRVL